MLDFPNAPTVGQKFPAPPLAGLPVYTWDGEKWTTIAGSPGSVGGSSQVYIGDTAPVGVADNSLWWESDTGLLYVRYNDGNSTAWIQIAITPVIDTSPLVAKAGDTMTGLLTLSGDPTTALQAATKRYVDAAGGLMRGAIAGLTLSTAGSSTTFSVAPGMAADSTNAVMISFPNVFSKTTAAWAIGGAGQGALDTGVIVAGAFYHVYLIRRASDGLADVLISASATAPTLPSGFTQFRRIGAMLTNGSGQWTSFSQLGDEFLWASPASDVVGDAIGAASKLYNLTVPTGVQVFAKIRGQQLNTAIGGTSLITSPDEAVQVTNSPLGNLSSRNWSTSTGAPWGELVVRTNTSGQVRAVAQANSTLWIATCGWLDRRGKDN